MYTEYVAWPWSGSEVVLSDMKQYVTYRDIDAVQRDIICEVPQGGVIGIFLFIMYTNELPNAITHPIASFSLMTQPFYESSNNLIVIHEII